MLLIRNSMVESILPRYLVSASLALFLIACEGPDPKPGITVSPTSNLITTESGDSAEFSLVLTSEPKGDVRIEVQSNQPNEGVPEPSEVVFNSGNWGTAQIIRVVGQDDAILDGDVHYTVVTLPSDSSDSDYHGINPPDVMALNLDDEGANGQKPSAQILISALSVQTEESGVQTSFSVSLSRAPAQGSEVIISASSSDSSEGTVAPDFQTFSANDWSEQKSFIVSGVDDDLVDGDMSYSILLSVSSDDPDFNNINAGPITVTNVDDESPAAAAAVVINPNQGLITSEDQDSAIFMVKLSSAPSDTVSVQISSNDSSEGVVNPTQLQFTAADYTVEQTVTVTGVNDAEIDGDITYQVLLSATSTDPAYNNIDISPVEVSNLDNDPETAASVPSPSWPGTRSARASSSSGAPPRSA